MANALLEAIAEQLPTVTAIMVGGLLLILVHETSALRAASFGVMTGTCWLVARAGGQTDWLNLSGQSSVEATTILGLALLVGGIAARLALLGPIHRAGPLRRVRGRRAVYGNADWLTARRLMRLFPPAGGIVLGERDRPDLNSARGPFRADDPATWGDGGRAPLLCFDCSFGSTHGLVFAGSGGFKTTSVTIPTALAWPSGLVVLDPSCEVLPMIGKFRRQMGRMVVGLDPTRPEIGFNALDWIGQSGSAPEEDIVSVANWIIAQTGRAESVRDDFFRGTAVQLLTALIADVCLSGHTPAEHRTLRQVRANLAEPEPRLRERLQAIYDDSASPFVKENVAPFINMTPETFSGVYASAAKETHWLSYENYAALVSGSALRTDQVAQGAVDVFINLNLQTLESHPGLARVIVGALSQAVFNRKGRIAGRTLFLLDEAARLGYMAILEIIRDAGRKYGITLVLMFQSLGQLREAYGSRDATSKWFESASWISFATINDLETAEYISRRCGEMTVEVDQVTRSGGGSSRSRSRQLVRHSLITPSEVMAMRADEQIIFSPGSPPIRAGRAIFFRRLEMRNAVGDNPYRQRAG